MKKNKTKKILKAVVIILISVIILLLAAYFLIEHFEQEIADRVIAKIVKKSKRIHSIHYGAIDLDLLKRSIRIENLSINGDKESGSKFSASFPLIEIEGISLQKLIFHKLFYIENLRAANWEIVYADGFYKLTAKELNFSKAKSTITVDFLDLIPKYERYEFARKRGYRSNRVRLKVRSLTFHKIGFKDLFKERKLFVKLLKIKKPQLDLFRNKNVRKHSRPKVKRLPQQLLRDLKIKLRIDDIKITKGKIVYSEHAVGERRPGKISFADMQAELKNVTNYPELLQEKVSTILTLSSRLMDKGMLRLKMVFPVYHKGNKFKFSGSLGKIRLDAFQSIFENNAHIRINRGVVDRLTFWARADNNKAIGEMHFLYNNLKVSLLKKGGKYKKKKFLSFLANTLVYNSNPRSGKPARVGIISYKPEKKLSIFNYMWRALLTGIKSSISIKRSKRRK